jgi:hypothetical protein
VDDGTRTPDAPWALVGECMVALVVGARPGRGPLPAGVGRLPGPSLVVAVRYSDSPVGPFLELAIAEPARLGLRPGFCVTTSVVSAAPARIGGRLGWGFPRELGRLTWATDGDDRLLRWEERGFEVRGRAGRLVLPFLVPLRSLQRRADGPVVVPGRVRGRVHPGRVLVDVPDDDELFRLAGHHQGMTLTGMRLLLRPARRPAGLVSTLRAPLRAAEPAMTLPAPAAAAVAARPLQSASPGA